ncbi:MAG: hypothetical protein MJ065_05785 [Oscillospiraceae bacterium]|nr:hypothetical protein [Oscillospiraceae bacterium]
MNKLTGAAALTAALSTLLTGCGQHATQNAEAVPRQTTAVTEIAAGTGRVTDTVGYDSGNDLYEDDDIHRKTDSEPDLIDRAESVIEDPEGAYSEMMTDMQEAMDKID